MKLQYREFITGIKAEIDLTTDRETCGLVMADAYCKATGKRKTQHVKDYFIRDCGMYHAVRDILEDIETENFEEVTARFAELYPTFHQDWKYALKTGIVVKAGKREGNYYNTPFIYNDETAIAIREAGVNFLAPIIETILSKHTENKYHEQESTN